MIFSPPDPPTSCSEERIWILEQIITDPSGSGSYLDIFVTNEKNYVGK
jgi:hypothetical protein